MTADVRRSPRRGTPSACAIKRTHRPQAREIVACEHGTRPSLGPSTRARQSSLCSAGESPGGGAPSETSRSGKPSQGGRTGTGVSESGRSAARRASPFPQGRGRDATKKRKEIEVSVPARAEEPGFGCPHVVVAAVAEVGRRRLVSNKLGKRAPKRAAGSSERGPSVARESAGETVGERAARKERRESASPLKTGEDRRKAQGGERSSSSGFHIAKSGGGVAGPGL